MEPRFAEAKDWHRLRGWGNVIVEGLMIATGQNLQRVLAATGWSRHHAAGGNVGALPKPPHRPIADLG